MEDSEEIKGNFGVLFQRSLRALILQIRYAEIERFDWKVSNTDRNLVETAVDNVHFAHFCYGILFQLCLSCTLLKWSYTRICVKRTHFGFRVIESRPTYAPAS